jgi:hypothetical protein
MTRKLTFEFPSDEAATAFAEWLCDAGGEQHYANYCDDEPDERPQVCFRYHPEDTTKEDTDPNRYGPFLDDWTIRCTSMP